MRLRSAFFSKPPTPPRYRSSDDAVGTELSASLDKTPSSPSVVIDSTLTPAPTVTTKTDDERGSPHGTDSTPVTAIEGTPQMVEKQIEEEDVARTPTSSGASKPSSSSLSASPTPAPRPPAAPGAKPPLGRRPLPRSTTTRPKTSGIWPWKRGLGGTSDGHGKDDQPVANGVGQGKVVQSIETVLSTDSDSSLLEGPVRPNGVFRMDSGWPTADFSFPKTATADSEAVQPLQPGYPTESGSVLLSEPALPAESNFRREESERGSTVETGEEPRNRLRLGLEVSKSSPTRISNEGTLEQNEEEVRFGDRGDDGCDSDNGSPMEGGTRRERLLAAVTMSPAGDDISFGHEARAKWLLAARDQEPAGVEERADGGVAGEGERHHKQPVKNHRRRWSNPFSAAAAAKRTAAPARGPGSSLTTAENAGKAREERAASSGSAVSSSTPTAGLYIRRRSISGSSATTPGRCGGGGGMTGRSSGSKPPGLSAHPYLNAEGIGRHLGPNGERAERDGVQVGQSNSTTVKKLGRFFSEAEKSFKNGSDVCLEEKTKIARTPHGVSGDFRGVSLDEDDLVPDELPPLDSDRRKKAVLERVGRTCTETRDSGTVLLDSPFFCKENGTDDMELILRNDDMRMAFKKFLTKRWCVENLDFVEGVISYQTSLLQAGAHDPAVLTKAKEIEEAFVARGSPREVNIGQDMRQNCLKKRAQDLARSKASMNTFNAVAFELISMMAHTTMRDFKLSPGYAAIEACLHEGPRDARFSGATSSMTYDEDDLEELVEARARDKPHMSEAEHHVADWYGLDLEDTPNRPRTWC